MTKISYIRIGLLSAVLTLTTAIATPAIANTIQAETTGISMPQLTPDQIARDVRSEFNNRTGQREFVAPTFDPFEEDASMAGSVSLRSMNTATSIDGQPLRGGAILDIGFYYNSPSADPFDTRGFDEVIFLNGEIAPAIRRDNRVLECSSNVRETVYDHRTYYAPRVGFNFYRPYRHYHGHFGYPGYRRSVFGGFHRDRGYRNHGYDYYGYGYGSRQGGYRDYRGGRDRDRARRDDRDRNDRDRGDRLRDDRANNDGGRGVSRATPQQRRQLVRDGQGRNPAGFRRATREQRLTSGLESNREQSRNSVRPRNDRVRNTDDAVRSDLTPRQQMQRNVRNRQADRTRQTDRRVVREQSVPRSDRSDQPATARGPRGISRSTVRVDRSTPNTVKSAPARPARVERRSEPKRSEPRRSDPTPSTTKSNTRSSSSPSSSPRSLERGSKSNRSIRGGKRLNFFPPDYGYGGREVVTSVDVDCAREETLSIFIPNERLDAARFDGMTLLVLDREGREYPIFVPPNYIEGFQIARNGARPGYIAPPISGDPRLQTAPSYQQPLNCPTGTTAQPDGTCMVTSATYRGYP